MDHHEIQHNRLKYLFGFLAEARCCVKRMWI